MCKGTRQTRLCPFSIVVVVTEAMTTLIEDGRDDGDSGKNCVIDGEQDGVVDDSGAGGIQTQSSWSPGKCNV